MIELTLPTMSCGHCVRTVNETVRRVDPEATVEVDLAAQRVQIASDKPAAAFAEALAAEGYAAAEGA